MDPYREGERSLTPGATEAHALLHLLNVMEADAALAAVNHDHGLPVVRAQPLRLAKGARDAGAAVRRPARVRAPVAVHRSRDHVGAFAGMVAGRALAGGRVRLGGHRGGKRPQVGFVGAVGSVRALRAALVAGRRSHAAVGGGGCRRGERREERERQDDGRRRASARHGGVVEKDEPSPSF